MKKLLGILVLSFLYSGNAYAGIDDIGSGEICGTVKGGYEGSYSDVKNLSTICNVDNIQRRQTRYYIYMKKLSPFRSTLVQLS